MKAGLKTKTLRIGGMTCVNCQNAIQRKLRNTAGIKTVVVSYNKETAQITYDTDIISLKDISAAIEKLGYEVPADGQKANNLRRIAGILIIIAALYVIIQHFGLTQFFGAFPLAEAGMGYGMLFVIGLVTSVHCVAMCGGINLSQTISKAPGTPEAGRLKALRPSFLYNLGRVVSYTVIGGIVGALGSVISFSGAMKGMVQLFAGVFMVIMGLNMLGIFPWLRKLNIRMPGIFARKIESEKTSGKGPLYVGLLNGLMPCGPLQAMQLYALSTGDPIKGALSMMLFSLGTVPLMFGLGALSSVLSKKFTGKVVTAGAMLVVVLGISMFSSGWTLSGISSPGASAAPSGQSGQQVQLQDGYQSVTTTLQPGRYEPITVEVGIPVKWTIQAPPGSVNGCNNRIFLYEYEIEKPLQVGENVIEFTPTKTGSFTYSCWMGMISSKIHVVEQGAAQ
ncbi:MAG: sulfite exporter TauE/SafE family protein [Christensenellales bacterium]|jgi:sulfite exporter TauE/SafE